MVTTGILLLPSMEAEEGGKDVTSWLFLADQAMEHYLLDLNFKNRTFFYYF